jgi:hypothetical protein
MAAARGLAQLFATKIGGAGGWPTLSQQKSAGILTSCPSRRYLDSGDSPRRGFRADSAERKEFKIPRPVAETATRTGHQIPVGERLGQPPVVSTRLNKIELKIERAKQHIRDLDAAVRGFVESKPYALGAKAKPEIHHTALYVSRVDPIPSTMGLIVGDAIHNLRSSLDHLAWQLVEAGGGSPDVNTMFPICNTAKQYTAAIKKRKVKGVAPGAEKLIDAVQPYATGDTTLSHINELDIFDKHRLVVAVTSVVTEWFVNSYSGATIRFPEGNWRYDLEVGREIVNIPTSTYAREEHENFKLGIDVMFGEPKVLHGQHVLGTLNRMTDFVINLIRDFEPFLV